MHSGKRILCSALAMATIIPMACVGSSSVVASAATKPTVTLKLITGDKTLGGLDRVQAAVNTYLKKKNTGIAIQWTTMGWDDLKVKTNNMLQTGQNVDIMNTASWMTPGYISHCQSGQFTDLTKYVNSKAYASTVKIIGRDYLDGTKVNGKYYGMPSNKEKAHNFGILCQTKELNKLGVKASSIKTLAGLAKYFDKVKKDGYIPICAQGMDSFYKLLDWDAFDSDTSTFAFDPKNEKTVVNPFTASKTIAFYKLMTTYHNKGYFSSDVLTSKGEEQDMATGKYFCGDWSLMPGKAITESSSLKMKLSQIDITPVEKTNRETLGCLLAIPKASKHPAEAFKFISMLYTDKTLLRLMTYGVAGTDYTNVTKDIIKVNSKTDFNTAGAWIMGNEFNNYLTTDQSKTLYKDIAKYNAKGKALKDLGFVFNNSKVKTEYSATQTVITKYYPQLFYGTCNVNSTVAAMKSELNKAGQAKLIKTVQTQYNAWCKANHKK